MLPLALSQSCPEEYQAAAYLFTVDNYINRHVTNGRDKRNATTFSSRLRIVNNMYVM